MSSPPRPRWLYVLIGTSSLPVVEVLFRYSATGAENVPADVLDAVTALGRSFA